MTLLKGIIVISAIYATACVSADAQTDTTEASDSCAPPRIARKPSKSKIISMGTLNGVARNLSKPHYPAVAYAMNISGTVQVQVLIDEQGCVIEAKAIAGHLLLRSNSVKAAFGSSFHPVLISGSPIRVSGVIFYNYLPNQMNWLELGYSSDSAETLINYLPPDFDLARRSIKDLDFRDVVGGNRVDDAVIEQIRVQLAPDPKGQWLFILGRQLKMIDQECWNVACTQKDELKGLLQTAPELVSSKLIAWLGDLLGQTDIDRFREKLLTLKSQLFELGH